MQTNWIRYSRGAGLSWVGCLPQHCLARALHSVILAHAQFHWDNISTGTRKAIVTGGGISCLVGLGKCTKDSFPTVVDKRGLEMEEI